MGRLWTVLTRKKPMEPVAAEESRLARVFNAFDLTALGVGSTLGVGIYVLAGQVARTTAGPSVVLSFLIAAIASLFAGLCYAEFGARVPKAGSAYVYTYVCVGEFAAFVIGWNLILEYVIGSASVARGISLYLDTLLNNTLQDTFRDIAPIDVAYLAPYFDFFSFGISLLLTVGLAFGLKESSRANNVVTCLNIGVVLFIIVAGALQADPANWRLSPNATANGTEIGAGGFFPWGVEGMIKGAATCFYGFVGFDCIATTGEEVRNPRRAIPFSIMASLLVVFLAYFGVATVLTLMVPYYLQDVNAPIPMAFEAVGWGFAKWIVAVGALFGLCASLFGAMFPLPRIIYAMGSDGLVFRVLARVHARFQTPVVGTILAGLLTGLMSALFDLSQLVNMMSIGTLQAYTIVAASVLLLRYNDDTVRQSFEGPEREPASLSTSSIFKYLINCGISAPAQITSTIVAVEVLVYCLLCVGVAACAIYLQAQIAAGDVWAVVLTSVLVGLGAMVIFSMSTQPQSRQELAFKVPLVPLIPAISILVNVYLMLMLDSHTWVRFAVWMALGLPMYYICACAPRPKLTPATSLTNGLAKQAAPPPLEAQQEAALAQLDRVLDTEAERLSISDSMSNVSRAESVVADVHCADVVTPVADPPPYSPPLYDTPSLDSGIGDSAPNLADCALMQEEPQPEEEEQQEEVAPPPPPPPPPNEAPPIAVPSADYLKTVNLRHVQTQLKQWQPEGNPNASDDNLKVGSPEYRSFITNLNSRLQRAPIYQAPPPKRTEAPPPAEPNENVVVEHIDPRDAAEKLRNFYAAKSDTSDSQPPV